MHSSGTRPVRSSSRLLGGCLPQCILGYTPWAWAWAWTPPSLAWATPPRPGRENITFPQLRLRTVTITEPFR